MCVYIRERERGKKSVSVIEIRLIFCARQFNRFHYVLTTDAKNTILTPFNNIFMTRRFFNYALTIVTRDEMNSVNPATDVGI